VSDPLSDYNPEDPAPAHRAEDVNPLLFVGDFLPDPPDDDEDQDEETP
jgi:hypothetical protein